MRAIRVSLVLVALFWLQLSSAQTTLGALLDAGAKSLSPEEFKQQLVQRMIVGPTPAGGTLEVMYTTNGVIQGDSRSRIVPAAIEGPWSSVNGEWKVDEQRICTSMRIGGGATSSAWGSVYLPFRCQYWYKLGDKYFFSDSDTDRSAKVLERTIKQ
jgi:hypothetical protein